LAQQLGGINPICLVYRITNSVHLIDFLSGQSKLYDNDMEDKIEAIYKMIKEIKDEMVGKDLIQNN